MNWVDALFELVVSKGLDVVSNSSLPAHLKRQARERLNDFNPFSFISANHDLLRAARRAWIIAVLNVLDVAKSSAQSSGPEFDRQQDVLRFEKLAREALLKIREDALDRRTHPGNSPIDRHLETIIQGTPEFISPGDNTTQSQSLTQDFAQTLAEICGWPLLEVPPMFTQIARNGIPMKGGGHNRSFGMLVFAAFAEILKSPDCYPEALPAFNIAMQDTARKLSEKILTRTRGIDEKTDRLIAGVDASRVFQEGAQTYLAQLPQLAVGHEIIIGKLDILLETASQGEADLRKRESSVEYDNNANNVKNYFNNKLEGLKDFLVDSPNPEEDKSRKNINVKHLRELLKNSKVEFEKPQLIKVRGTLFPAALLTAGWWERAKENELDIRKGFNFNELQKWLFEGFDVWAPSWDVSWGLETSNQESKPHYIAQLTDGDEADSLIVIIPPKFAAEWREKFKSKRCWGGYEVEITGVLGHRSQAQKEVPHQDVLWGQPTDYCIWLKDDDNQCKIEELGTETDLYSGYLWQCVIPKKSFEEKNTIKLDDVYIVWEHTNFAAKAAYNYNLSSLRDKISYIEKKEGDLILLQKSHGLLVPGDPIWNIEEFYKILSHKTVENTNLKS